MMPGGREAGKLGSREAGKLGSWEAGQLYFFALKPSSFPASRLSSNKYFFN